MNRLHDVGRLRPGRRRARWPRCLGGEDHSDDQHDGGGSGATHNQRRPARRRGRRQWRLCGSRWGGGSSSCIASERRRSTRHVVGRVRVRDRRRRRTSRRGRTEPARAGSALRGPRRLCKDLRGRGGGGGLGQRRSLCRARSCGSDDLVELQLLLDLLDLGACATADGWRSGGGWGAGDMN